MESCVFLFPVLFPVSSLPLCPFLSFTLYSFLFISFALLGYLLSFALLLVFFFLFISWLFLFSFLFLLLQDAILGDRRVENFRGEDFVKAVVDNSIKAPELQVRSLSSVFAVCPCSS